MRSLRTFPAAIFPSAPGWVVLALVISTLAIPCAGRYETGTRLRRSPRASRLKTIQLPQARSSGSVSLEEALVKQQRVRPTTDEPLRFEDIGQLVWAGQGMRGEPNLAGTPMNRTSAAAPSADETQPLQLYVATQDGVYLYKPNGHSLEQTSADDARGGLAAEALGQEGSAPAGCHIVVAGSARHFTTQYGRRARSLMLVLTGQVAQNIQLQAASMELGYVPIINFDVAAVRRLCRLPRNLEPLHVLAVGYPLGRAVRPASPGLLSSAVKKAVLIVARENFHDEELFETRRALDAASVQTVIASTRMGFVVGMAGNRAEVNVMVSRLNVDDYDAVVFLGGLGAVEYFGNPGILSIARQAVTKGKVVAAISVAPTILANAGVLTGKRATSFITERDRLQQAGAVYTGTPVQRDGSIITAVGPMAASQFGRAIADALAGR